GAVGVENLDAVVAAVADIELAVIGDLHAMHRVAEEGGMAIALGGVGDPASGGAGGGVIHRIVAIGAEVADVLSGIGIDDQDAAVAIAVRDIEPVGLRIDHHVGGFVQRRRAVDAGIGVVAVGRGRRAADPHLEIAVHVELQDEAVAALAIGGPGRGIGGHPAAVAGDPDIVLVVDIDAMFAVGPDAAIGGAAVRRQ